MRQDNLPSPGVINYAHELRRLSAQAISYHEVQVHQRGGVPADDAVELRDFFLACAAAVPVPAEPEPEA